jgi:hypothetical protein
MTCPQEIKKNADFIHAGTSMAIAQISLLLSLRQLGDYYFSSAKFYEDGINLPIAIGIGMLKHYSGN